MSDTEFDTALVASAFRLAGEVGWGRVNAAVAAREAGLSVAEARERFASRNAILLRFGRMADQEALRDAPSEGPVRDRLFDLLMRRIDVLQAHRAGVKALLRTLSRDPGTALLILVANQRSMRWMLQVAGISATGPRGELQAQGLLGVWLWAVRAWDRDDSMDLSGTMAAIDTALNRAESMASWMHRDRAASAGSASPGPTSSATAPAVLGAPGSGGPVPGASVSGAPVPGASVPGASVADGSIPVAPVSGAVALRVPSPGSPGVDPGGSTSAAKMAGSSTVAPPPVAKAAGELDPSPPPPDTDQPLPKTGT